MIKRIFSLISLFFFHSIYTQNWLRSLKCASASSAYYAQRYDQAYKCYEELLVDDPFDRQVVRGLADCLYSKNNFDDAEKYYGQLSLRVDNSTQEAEEIYFNYGCAQAQQKKYKEALVSFENVVKVNQQHERAKKNIEILKKLLEQKKQEQKEQQKNKDQNKEQNQDQKEQQDQQNKQDEQNKSDQQQSDQQDRNKEHDQQDQQDQKEKEQKQEEQKQPDQQNAEKQKENQSPQPQPLPEQMQAILQQAGELEKQGQQLYMRALAGQQKEAGADYAW
ncbi:TPA: hypothetical protein DIC20_03005 [Candidatus Dependentiae bacterium]|nr:MAG: hypothetical protein US03_C0014G0013 [candidate division TM6 bacterium GW2011_GWF2_36_131]KKQ02529.1 MAG: hypothetical protein US13_C0015G0013 [candidate division TM6 bacterium GW2011_GWE2_36_25]KKQ19275.1 MAG: hypothetical protein US32_C0012G0013 [candidate division TM6 bacterium GW2011_GWA2_36_9]HBR70116.1 hypothetical protein [Candidatus Dependentiae bacterium]HCU00644.1 hypothetical protein [Candidatus Dependentiae bacterium]